MKIFEVIERSLKDTVTKIVYLYTLHAVQAVLVYFVCVYLFAFKPIRRKIKTQAYVYQYTGTNRKSIEFHHVYKYAYINYRR